MMKLSLSKEQLVIYIKNQIDNFFPDEKIELLTR